VGRLFFQKTGDLTEAREYIALFSELYEKLFDTIPGFRL